MRFERIGRYYFLLGFLFLGSFFILSFIRFFLGMFFPFWGDYIIVDFVGFSFSLISVILFICLVPIILGRGFYSFLLLLLRVLFSVFCYFCVHSLLFWVFYELSILSLLVLLVLDSPYSERYVAGWYLLGYVVFTRLPMFLCILWVSARAGSYNLLVWGSWCFKDSCVLCLLLLSIFFITKIPLIPFHVWLPIVHAEAPSPVSVCLRGYIMKLGILGLYRLCWSVLPDYVFSSFYSFLVLLSSALFFIASCRELDGKRWLAFLSLSHIGFVCFSICLGAFSSIYFPFYFCLGHGLSAGVIFVLLWFFYSFSSSRSWSVLKSGLVKGAMVRALFIAGVFSAASIPPTLTFFSEVLFLNYSVFCKLFLSLLFSLYLFSGGLVPLFLLGFTLGRGYRVSLLSFRCWPYFLSVFASLTFIYLLFFVV